MPTRKDPKLVKNIHDVGPPRPSASSPAGDDPMVKKPEEATAPPLSSHGRNIEPPKHDVPSSESSSGKPAGASPSDIIEKSKARQEAGTSEPEPSKAEPDPTPSPGGESTSSPADEASPEPSGDEPSARSSLASDEGKTTTKQDDAAAKAAAESAEAERQAKYDEMVASGKYFLPINEAKQRYARKLLLALVIVLLILVAIDLLYDTGTLKSNSFNFHTHFFGS